MNKVNILGVKIDDVSLDEAIKIVEGWMKDKNKYYIVTTNSEFIITAQEDPGFKKILNDADLSIPDGIGLKLSGVKNKVSGIDLMEKLVEKSIIWGATVGFLGGRDDVAEKVAECLLTRYPKLKVSFASSEPSSRPTETPITDLLFVAFGHPKQEKWIAQNLPKIPVKVIMGVGGAFDFLSGKVPRAPKWIRSMGLEWLFRLIIQPWRVKRQIALLKFLWLIMLK